MAFYRTCPLCGANLDPGEKCDCRETLEDAAECRPHGNPRMKRERLVYEEEEREGTENGKYNSGDQAGKREDILQL